MNANVRRVVLKPLEVIVEGVKKKAWKTKKERTMTGGRAREKKGIGKEKKKA